MYKDNIDANFTPIELPDRGAAALLLPVTKDSRTKEENHKLLNGNAGDPTDRVMMKSIFNYLSLIIYLVDSGVFPLVIQHYSVS